MVEITLPIVLQIVQTVGILVGIAYYITIMRNSQKTQDLSLKAQEQALETRKAQLYMQIYSRLDDNEFWENYGRLVYEYEYKGMDDFLENYSPGTKTGGYASYMSMNAFFRGIGSSSIKT